MAKVEKSGSGTLGVPGGRVSWGNHTLKSDTKCLNIVQNALVPSAPENGV